jgi:hypothetical protein
MGGKLKEIVMEKNIFKSWEISDIKINKVKNCFSFGGEFMYEIEINGKRQSTVTHNVDTAILMAIGIKYDGVNTQFGTFACKMLNIDE